jgi:ribosomal protein S18 acetylase RimI-like enzyme
MPNFKVVPITDGRNQAQIEQYVAMMTRMYDFHATLHSDWQTSPGWQESSIGWISRTAGSEEYYFALAYPLDDKGNPDLETPAGYVMASFHYEAPFFIQSRFGYIVDLWIEEAFRKQSVAPALLAEADQWFKSQGVSRVQLYVDVRNQRGQKFWEQVGYAPFEIVMRKDV